MPVQAGRKRVEQAAEDLAYVIRVGRALGIIAVLSTQRPDAKIIPTSITGPSAPVQLPSENVDWEVELVVAIGRRAYKVPESAAWDHVAGLMVGQDLSERVVQLAGSVPQFGPAIEPVQPAVRVAHETAFHRESLMLAGLRRPPGGVRLVSSDCSKCRHRLLGSAALESSRSGAGCRVR